MPVGFLTPAQRERYGRYPNSLSADELARCLHLDDDDREWIAGKRRDSNRLQIAIETLSVLAGKLPPRAMGLVMEWSSRHQDELMTDWDLARQQAALNNIAPLE